MTARSEPGATPVDRQTEASVDATVERPERRNAAFGVSVAVALAGLLWVVVIVVVLALW